MHEARVSFRWLGNLSSPVSTAPQVQVAGAFTGGGATLGPQQIREFGTEIADDAIWTHGAHTLKVGINLRTYREREQMTQNFNGTYIFGGGIAPVLDANGNATTGSNDHHRAGAVSPRKTVISRWNADGVHRRYRLAADRLYPDARLDLCAG